jgi:hypothetical protein
MRQGIAMTKFITDNQKLIGGILMFGLWAFLVLAYKAPVDDLITWIKIGLGAVFGIHAVTNFSANPPPQNDQTKEPNP